jgi:uncharacterized RDD family membrane protein YckC
MPNYTIQGADGQQYGPVDATTLSAWAREGRLVPSTRVFDHETEKWAEARTLSCLAAIWQPSHLAAADSGTEAPTAQCTECMRHFPEAEMIHYGNQWVCAACKPVFFQKIKEGVNVAVNAQYAGFWIRVAAKLIDGLVMAIPMLLVMGLIFYAMWDGISSSRSGGMPPRFEILINVLQLVSILVGAVYNTFMIGRYGATLGKMACGLKVIVATGDKVSYPRALGRHFAEMLSGLICYIGYFMVGFDDEKRALHDHICNTRVVRK